MENFQHCLEKGNEIVHALHQLSLTIINLWLVLHVFQIVPLPVLLIIIAIAVLTMALVFLNYKSNICSIKKYFDIKAKHEEKNIIDLIGFFPLSFLNF